MSFLGGLTAVIFLLNLVLLGYGLWQLNLLRDRLSIIDAEAASTLSQVQPAAQALGAQLKQQAPMVISIEILNPMQVAKSRSKLAGPLSSFSPNLIRNRVYDQARDMIQHQLAEEGVQATVNVVRQARERR